MTISSFVQDRQDLVRHSDWHIVHLSETNTPGTLKVGQILQKLSE